MKFDVLQLSCVLRISWCVKFVSLLLPISKDSLCNHLRSWYLHSTIRQRVIACSTSAKLSVISLVKSTKGFGHLGVLWRY